MASRALAFEAAPLDVLLASVPNLPCAPLTRLTACMIARGDHGGDASNYLGRFATAACGLTSCLTNQPVSGEIQSITVIAFRNWSRGCKSNIA